MRTINLPISPTERFAGPAMTVGLALAVTLAPVESPWQWTLSLVVLLLGLLQQHRYRTDRPYAVTLSAGGGIVLHQAAGRVFAISRIRVGYVGSGLVTARCSDATGSVVNLFIPSSTVQPEEHRQLRKALLAIENRPRLSEDQE